MRQPIFVLTRPQMGENIGASARAMLNFGLDHMRLVAPRDGWPNPAAVAMASGAGRVLDNALLTDTLADAVADATTVFATTARARCLTKEVLSPAEAMKRAALKQAAGEKVAIVFGPERAGLENDEIAQANAIITLPVNPDFASLNLAQSVLILAYEWRRATADMPAAALDLGKTQEADHQEIENLARHYEDRLQEAGFFFPEAKAEHMKINLRNLWSRMPLTRADVQMLHGVLRQMFRWKVGGPKP